MRISVDDDSSSTNDKKCCWYRDAIQPLLYKKCSGSGYSPEEIIPQEICGTRGYGMEMTRFKCKSNRRRMLAPST